MTVLRGSPTEPENGVPPASSAADTPLPLVPGAAPTALRTIRRLGTPLPRLLCLGGILLAGWFASAGEVQTVHVPMRDGTRLATDLYLPDGTGPWPVILIRTPYSKAALANVGTDGMQRGYAMVIQDCRGRFASEGDNLPFEHDAVDGPATLEWVLRQPWCNRRIGTWGGSALAITQFQLAGQDAPQPRAQYLVVGEPNLYAGIYPGGVFKKAMVEDWLRMSKFADTALAHWVKHPRYDAYWAARDATRRFPRVTAAAVHVGGWYDIFARGTVRAFLGYQNEGGPGARGRQKLVMGPWAHAVGQTRVGDWTLPDTARQPPSDLLDPWAWFAEQLQGHEPRLARLPPVTYYVLGDMDDPHAPGREWRTAREWPPPESRLVPWYLHADATLGPDRPASPHGEQEYVYDPDAPVPTRGGPQLTLPAGPVDQAPVETRPDVLVFTSAPLTRPLELTGDVQARLWIRSDAPDTDVFVRLCDVYPDGRSFNLVEGALRLRFRHGFDREVLLVPNQVEPVAVELGPISVVINRGHRLRVQVTSCSAPGYDPNPNHGGPFRSAGPARKARNTVLLNREAASHLLFPVCGADF